MNNTTSLIEKEGIALRAVEPDDIDFLYLAENDSQAWSASATVAPMSRHILQQYLEQYRADLYADRQLRLIAIERKTGNKIGIADLYDYDPRNNRCGVGIYIAPNMRGKGYGRLMLGLLSVYAQEFLGIHNLYAIISTDNTPSRHVFAHCGYSEVAILPQWIKTSRGYTSAVFTTKIAPQPTTPTAE